MKRVLLAGMAIVFALPFLHAQNSAPPTIKMRTDVSPKVITIGDPILVRIFIDYPPTVVPEPIKFPAKFETFELLDLRSLPPKTRADSLVHQEHRLILTTFSTGTHIVPPLKLVFQGPSKQPVQAQTPPVEIKVESLLEKYGDEGSLRPLKGFFNFRSYTWLWILLALLAGAALLAWVASRRKRRKNGAVAPGPPPRPPEEVVWETILDLEASTYLADGNYKEYYSRLSNALRLYLEGRFQMSALDRTSTELLGDFRRANFPAEHLSLLRTVLTNADLVKFAKLRPPENAPTDDLTRIKKFVHETTPAKEEKPRKEAMIS